MTTLDLKSSLIDKISKVDDPEFFEALNLFLDLKLENKVYYTSKAQKLMVEEGLSQLNRKEGISDIDLDRKVTEWLKEK